MLRNSGLNMRTAAVGLGLAMLAAMPALASVQILDATQDQTTLSRFTLDFGVYGGPRTAEISTTQFTLVADPITQQTYFTSYHQDVESLTLPGGIQTGPITVTILSSTPGAYNPATGAFQTNDQYLISFANDLSMYGFTSPVQMPGTASGLITYDLRGNASGKINSSWDGTGELVNQSDPQNPIQYSYQCETNTQFTQTPEPAGLALAGLALALVRRR